MGNAKDLPTLELRAKLADLGLDSFVYKREHVLGRRAC